MRGHLFKVRGMRSKVGGLFIIQRGVEYLECVASQDDEI